MKETFEITNIPELKDSVVTAVKSFLNDGKSYKKSTHYMPF